jgi:hypothetical protein
VPKLVGLDIHIVEAEAEAAAKANNGESDKGDLKFATYLKALTGVSSFARNMTLKDQWEYLSAFACLEELMRCLRDNQGAPAISYDIWVITHPPVSRHCRWRNRIGKDAHSHVCRQTCQRGAFGLPSGKFAASAE